MVKLEERRHEILFDHFYRAVHEPHSSKSGSNVDVTDSMIINGNCSNSEARKIAKYQQDVQAKNYIIEILAAHWYHELDHLVNAELSISNGYKLSHDLKAQKDLEIQRILQRCRRQDEKILSLQASLDAQRRRCSALEKQCGNNFPKTTCQPSSDMASLIGLFSTTFLKSPAEDNIPYYKACAFGDIDEDYRRHPDDFDEEVHSHLEGSWHRNSQYELPLRKNMNDDLISCTGPNYDIILNCSTATAACELEHPAAGIGRNRHL